MRPHRLIIPLLCCLLVAGSAQTHKAATASAAKAPPDEQLYRNVAVGVSYKIPFGWVDRTNEMRALSPETQRGTNAAEPNPANANSKDGSANRAEGEVLLAVFERPPDATGETINSAVVIASESAVAYPGLKKPEDYIAPLTELTMAKGLKADGEPSFAEIDSRRLARVDFTKPLNDKLTMHQSTLIMLTKGRIISFTFVAGSVEEIDDLIDGLHLGAMKSAVH